MKTNSEIAKDEIQKIINELADYREQFNQLCEYHGKDNEEMMPIYEKIHKKLIDCECAIVHLSEAQEFEMTRAEEPPQERFDLLSCIQEEANQLKTEIEEHMPGAYVLK